MLGRIIKNSNHDGAADILRPPDFASFFENKFKRPYRKFKRNTILFSDGDYLDRIYFIHEGFVKLYRMSDEGKYTIAYLYGPGFAVGLRALLSEQKIARHSAIALTDIKVLSITHSEYFETVKKDPVFLIDLTHYFMDRLDYAERSIEMFVSMNVTARIAHFLIDFSQKYNISESEKNGFPHIFTHQMIADLIGSSRETVTLSMNRLKKKRILDDERGKVRIINFDKLRALSSR